MVIVDGQDAGQSHRVSCMGALIVDLVDGDPRFALHHHSMLFDMERDGLLAHVRDLSHNRHVVLASAHAFETFADHCHILLDGLCFLDVVEMDRTIRPTGLTLIYGRERWMDGLAFAFGLPRARGTDLDSMARYAATRAQLAWFAYVSSSLDRRRVRSLFAAYRAWQVLERARAQRF